MHISIKHYNKCVYGYFCTVRHMSKDMEKLIKMAQIENLEVQNVASDGDCMFASIALQLGRTIAEASNVRSEIIQYLRDHPDMVGGYKQYLLIFEY